MIRSNAADRRCRGRARPGPPVAMTTVSERNTAKPNGLSGVRLFGAISQRAYCSRLRFGSHQKPNACRVIENRDVQADSFPGQHLDHETRGPGTTAGRAAYLVVIGLIAEHAAEPILRNRQTHELQG